MKIKKGFTLMYIIAIWLGICLIALIYNGGHNFKKDNEIIGKSKLLYNILNEPNWSSGYNPIQNTIWFKSVDYVEFNQKDIFRFKKIASKLEDSDNSEDAIVTFTWAYLSDQANIPLKMQSMEDWGL
jgi:hypothetical protein